MIEIPIIYIPISIALHIAELAGLITVLIMLVCKDDRA